MKSNFAMVRNASLQVDGVDEFGIFGGEREKNRSELGACGW